MRVCGKKRLNQPFFVSQPAVGHPALALENAGCVWTHYIFYASSGHRLNLELGTLPPARNT